MIPVALEYVPALHDSQVVEPEDVLNVPLGHGMHELIVVAATVTE